MVRTAYDADTRQYTFLDTTDGTEYVSAPGNTYGTLVPAATASFPKTTRTSGRRTIGTYPVPPMVLPRSLTNPPQYKHTTVQ